MEANRALKISQLADTFKSQYRNNIQRGLESIEFTNCLQQWKDSIVNSRTEAGKESLTLPLIKTYLNKLKSQYDQITFTLTLKEYESSDFTQEEVATHKMLFNHFCLNGNFQKKLADTWKKGCDFGYAFIEVNFEREDDNTLNLVPCLRFHADPSIAYWANDFQRKSRIDGSYAGLVWNFEDAELRSKIPKKLLKKTHVRGENEVIYHWERKTRKVKYFCLKGGEYKRADLIDFESPEERDEIERDDLGLYKFCLEDSIGVYFTLIINDKVVIDRDPFPNQYLPLPYWYGFSEWKKEGNKTRYYTQPFTEVLKGIQRTHNYAWSQIATTLKAMNAPKLVGNKNHILTDEEQKTANNFNRLEGIVILGSGNNDPNGAPVPLQSVPPAEISPNLLQLLQSSKEEMKELIGMFMDVQASDTTMVSGVALDKITKNMQISSTNSELIGAHVDFISDICLIIKEMIPKIITNRRKIDITQGNKVKAVIVNDRVMETGKVLNDLSKLNFSYAFEVTYSPTEEKANQNSIEAAAAFFNLPQTPDVMATKHLIAEQLPLVKKDEFIRLIIANQDPLLIAYSENKINFEQYTQQKQAIMQQQQQQQAMMAQEQLKSERIFADAERAKSNAIQYNEETKRVKALGDLQNDANRLQVDLVKYGGERQLKIAEHSLKIEQHNNELAQQAAEQYQAVQQQQQQQSSETEGANANPNNGADPTTNQ